MMEGHACYVRQALPEISVGSVAVVVPVEGVEEQLHVYGVRGHPHHRQRLAQVRQRERAVRDFIVVPQRENSLQFSDARNELEREVGDDRVRHAQPGSPSPRPRLQQHASPLPRHPHWVCLVETRWKLARGIWYLPTLPPTPIR